MAAPKTATPKESNRPEIKMGLLPNLMGFNLRCAQLTLFQHFGATVGKEGISAPQFGTLLLIEANPDISQSAVAEALRFDRSTLVQIIDRLEARDLVVRHISPTDRRSHALRLTEKGETELTNLKGLAVQHEADVAAALSEAERAQLIALLAKLHGG
ncbi:MAG: DNA-binding MarR family transcriptional regulator [Paracoccaceae bacterium]|jgi:DNA-binding MarR family transcriptional regulator